jgi:hypothetical protein
VLVLGAMLGRISTHLLIRAPRLAAYVIGSVAALWVFERSLAVIRG